MNSRSLLRRNGKFRVNRIYRSHLFGGDNMLTIDALKNYGADTATGLSRCMGNEALYLRLAGSIVSEQGFDRFKAAFDAGDGEAAYAEIHALKGALGNLSITPLYDKACEINERLRADKSADYSELMNEFTALKEEFFKLCE